MRSRLEASGVDKLAGGRAVLVGGACQLDGAGRVAAAILNKKCAPGGPLRLAGLADSTGGPAFSAAAGLLSFAMQHHAVAPSQPAAIEAPASELGGLAVGLGRILGNMLCGDQRVPNRC